MKAERKHLNCRVRVMNEESRFFGMVGRVADVRDGEAVVFFPNMTTANDHYIYREDDIELEDDTTWEALYRENKELRHRLDQIEIEAEYRLD